MNGISPFAEENNLMTMDLVTTPFTQEERDNLPGFRRMLATTGIVARPGSIESYNYVASTSGWKLTASGDLEANSGTFRGTITASSISIGTNAWHVDTSGNMWWGSSADYAGATIKISSAGSVNFTTGTFSGTLSAASGTLGAVTVGTDAFHIDSSGNVWWGSSSTYAGATIKISSAGSVNFTTGNLGALTVTGALTIGTGGSLGSGQSAYNTGTGFWWEYNGGTPRFSVGDGVHYLTWDGSSLDIYGQRFRPRFQGFYNDGLSTSVSNVTITRKIMNTQTSQATGGSWEMESQVLGYKGTPGAGTVFDWDNDYDFRFRLACVVGRADSGGLQGASMFYGLLANGISFSPALGTTSAITDRHVGFINDKNTKLYASCADGTTQTTSEITGITVTSEHNYRIIFDGSTAKFYVDDVLKATLSTNLPSGSTNPPDIKFAGYCLINTSATTDTLLYNNYELIILA